MIKKLNINIDHIATLRNARLANEPDPVHAVALVELAGAHGITVHLREDRRHIKDRDVELIRQITKTKLNLEMAATDEMVKIACTIKPEWVTLVPEKRQELTTEGGLDAVHLKEPLTKATAKLHDAGILVSLFVDPNLAQVDASQDIGADFIEIHTGKFANLFGTTGEENEFLIIKNAAIRAKELGLRVNAGHGLNYLNTQRMIDINEIEEFSIGHSIISRAVLVGLERAVKDMLQILGH